MSEDQEMAITFLKEKKLIKKGDQILFVGERIHKTSRQPQLRIVPVEN